MTQLIKILIEKNAINVDTEIEIVANNRACSALVKSVSNDLIFDCISTFDGKKMIIKPDAIVKIDGMSLERISDCYDVNIDGTSKKVHKKRGRKRKNAPVVESILQA